jgi:hypothetical protein
MRDLEIPLYLSFISLLTDCKEIEQALAQHDLTYGQYLSIQKAHPKWVKGLKERAAIFVDEEAREVDAILVRQRTHAQQEAEKKLVALALPAVERLKRIIEDDDQPSTRHLSAIKLLSNLLQRGFVTARVEADLAERERLPGQQRDPHDLDLTKITVTVNAAKSDIIDVTPG